MRKLAVVMFISFVFIVSLIIIRGVNKMGEVQFDIGKNIVQTAKASGVAGFSVQNIDGLLMYDANGLSPDGTARYARPGYEIVISPVFSLTLYADKKIDNNLPVQTAALQVSTKTITSHLAARNFVGGLIQQFQKGGWKRYIDNLCPAVTDRSSILDVRGEIGQFGACALDPNYHLSDDEWQKLMRVTQNYEWIGDGVLAKLTIGFNDFGRGMEYSIDLDFDDFSLKTKREREGLLEELAKGDAKGLQSTENHFREMIEIKKEIEILERNALERGDGLISRR